MQRKIIQQSATSVGITLPAKWVGRWNLKKGDVVTMEEKAGALTIAPVAFTSELKRASIDAHAYGKLSRRLFDNLSKRGYDEITISYSSERDLVPIKETLSAEATMFEIIRKENDHVVVRAISEINREELSQLTDRLVFLLLEMIRKLEECLNSPAESLRADILELEQANNRISHLCMRALHKHPVEEDSYLRYTFIWGMEKLANDFKFFAQCQKKPHHATVAAMRKCIQSMRTMSDIYFRFDSAKAVKLYDARNQLFEEGRSLLREKRDDHEIVHIMLSMNEKLISMLGLLFSVAHR
jgi:phosphate uptake regulator